MEQEAPLSPRLRASLPGSSYPSIHRGSVSLWLVSISPKDNLELFLKSILTTVFFGGKKYFSFTDNDDEISMLVDHETLESLQQTLGNLGLSHSLVVSPGKLCPIQVIWGKDYIGSTGLIARLCSSIAQGGIPLMLASLFSSDLMLVGEDVVDKVMELLESSASTFLEDKITSPKSRSDAKIVITPSDQNLRVISPIDTDRDLPAFAFSLLKEFVSPSMKEGRFFSYTCTPSEVCLILSEDILPNFDLQYFDVNPAVWTPIQVYGESTTDYSDDIDTLSSTMASSEVSLLYMSTFHTDYILVPQSQSEKAIQSLKDHCNVTLE